MNRDRVTARRQEGEGTGLAASPGGPSGRSGDITENLGRGAFMTAIAFLAFVGGALTILGQTFPYEPLRDAYRAGTALLEKRNESIDPLTTDQWREARTTARGVTVNEAAALPGYTLYTSGDGAYARLIAMDGRTVHEWRRPYSTVWNAQAAIKDPQPDDLIFMDKARLMPNGDLLAIYEAAGDTPWGYGMVKLDKDSNVIWRYLQATHHDFDVAPDGRIFALTQAFTSESMKGYETLDRPRLDDFLVTLSTDGKELRRISLTHALARSPYAGFLHATPAFAVEDPLHTNAVEYIDRAKAGKLGVGREGQVLVSFRDIGVIAVVDPLDGRIAWATRGPWLGQHDPSVLDNGHILLFDNFGGFRPGNGSRVLEIDPQSVALTWLYAGRANRPFLSEIRGAAQRLANGNTLITESDGGRLFEIAPDGRIVWEYLNPVRGGTGQSLIPVVSWGQRIAPEDLDPRFRAILDQQKTETSP